MTPVCVIGFGRWNQEAVRGTVERPFKSNCICIKYVSMKYRVA